MHLLNIKISYNTYFCFQQIDIRNMMIKIDMKISTTWLEPRLDYKNLRDNNDINIIEVSTGVLLSHYRHCCCIFIDVVTRPKFKKSFANLLTDEHNRPPSEV